MRHGILLAALIPAARGAAVGGAVGTGPQRDDLDEADRARVAAVTASATDFSKPERFETRPAGAGTSLKLVNADAFSHPLANLDFEQEQLFRVGNGIFRKLWVSAPSSTRASDGLGPFYNSRACQSCHFKDGRGHAPLGPDDDAVSMLVRLSVPARTPEEARALADGRLASIAEPTYGGQLQDFAVPGLAAEGRVRIDWEEVPVDLAGGETAMLRKPAMRIADLGYGPLDPETMMSARVAQPMIGLGLIEAIHEADILALADPDDRDGDGISGRPGMAFDETRRALVLGRFGWKASQPTIAQQTAHAFSGDIGISTPLLPAAAGDCTTRQPECLEAPDGVQEELGAVEAPDTVFDLVAFYTANLAVPARRDIDDPQVLEGKGLFYGAGCASCHQPKFVTRRDAENPAHRFQLIWPYSDFLLHDMGEELADGRPDGVASGREWRTPPLWGIGLTATVHDEATFLHDGRARTLLEAVLWHGGEAETARESVVAMTPDERAALIRFLESL